jgi:hypothetical protein
MTSRINTQQLALVAKRIAVLDRQIDLHPGQQKVIKAIFEQGKRRILILAGRNFGKANSLKSDIFTPTGWRKFGDLAAGDFVFAPDGTPTRVKGIGQTLVNHKLMKVKFIDGSEVICHPDHEWLTYSKACRKAYSRAENPTVHPSVVETKHIQKTLMVGKENNHFVKNCEPLQFPEADLPIHPYVLGVWLGDGYSSSGDFCGIDDEIAESIRALGYEVKVKGDDKCRIWKIEGLCTQLRHLGLQHNKKIPEKYLYASVEQRLELLKGLMDTDGYADLSGCKAEFANKNKSISEGLMFLLSSLGMKYTYATPDAYCNGKNCGPYYRISISPNQVIFKLSRKVSRQTFKHKTRPNFRAIVAVEDVPPEPVRCIQVEHPSGMYLIGKTLIPTHNSMVCEYASGRMSCFPGRSSYIIGPTRKQQKEIMWEPTDSRGLKHFFPASFKPKFTETENRIEVPWNSFVKIDGAEMHQSYRGIPFDLMVLDEAQDQDPRFYRAVYPSLLKKKGTIVVIGTMSADLNNWFMQLWQEVKTDPDWLVLNAPSWDNPHVHDFLQHEKNKYFRRGDVAEWMREFEAVYAVGGKKSVLPMYDPKVTCKPPEWIKARLDELKGKLEYWTIFDPGSKSVFAVLFLALCRDTSEVFAIDEIYEKDPMRTTPRIMIEEAKRKEAIHYQPGAQVFRVYDEAAAWFGIAAAVEQQYPMMPTTKASRDKMDDIGIIKDALLAQKLHVSDLCQKLTEEATSWQTDDNGKPIDKNDHLLDDLRYFTRMSGYTLNPVAIEVSFNNFSEEQRGLVKPNGLDDFSPEIDSMVDCSFDESIWSNSSF